MLRCYVSFQWACLGKRSPTNSTTVRFLSSMDYCVLLKMCLGREKLPTVWTCPQGSLPKQEPVFWWKGCWSTEGIWKFNEMSRRMPKPTKWPVCPAKTQISLGICPVWSESSLSTWRKLGSLATHWRPWSDWAVWVFAKRIVHFVGFVMQWLKCRLFMYGCSHKLKHAKGFWKYCIDSNKCLVSWNSQTLKNDVLETKFEQI